MTEIRCSLVNSYIHLQLCQECCLFFFLQNVLLYYIFMHAVFVLCLVVNAIKMQRVLAEFLYQTVLLLYHILNTLTCQYNVMCVAVGRL